MASRPKSLFVFAKAVLLLLLLATPSHALDLITAGNVQFLYAKNAAVAGPAYEYQLDFPMGSGNSLGLSFIHIDYFGKLNGLRLSAERLLFSSAESPQSAFDYSARVGVSYGMYVGEPVVVLKDTFADEIPTSIQELSLVIRPLCLRFGQFLLSALDTRLGINPVSPAGRLNLSVSVISVGERF